MVFGSINVVEGDLLGERVCADFILSYEVFVNEESGGPAIHHSHYSHILIWP